jgi:catechol 2,3-dioxygenase-like lactoylglutathione lyase family enzyme
MQTDTGPAATEPSQGQERRLCTAIVVADLARFVGWYESILGFTCTARMSIHEATVDEF